MPHDEIVRSLTGSGPAPSLNFTRVYPTEPADLWDALTQPERLARWYGRLAHPVSAPGDSFTVVLSDDPSDVGHGRVVRCEAPELLEVSWRWGGEPASRVLARLSPVPDGTRLVLSHTLGEPRNAVGYGGGWEECLASLAELLGGSPVGPEVEQQGVAAWQQLTRHPLELGYDLPADPGVVWAALTTVDGLRRWWWSHADDVEIEFDARVGGRYRFATPASGMAVHGEVLQLTALNHLAATWSWTDADGTSHDEAFDLFLEPVPTGTRLVVRHTGPWADPGPAQNYREGWEFTLAALRQLLSG